ncbi:MAG: CHASE2 domain-containing protein [Acidobacteriota bacterium]|nr:CHASE2 domain-containing protein [Acidobacteriota bacterium]
MRWRFRASDKRGDVEAEKRRISLLERTFKSVPAIIIGVVLTFALSRSGLFRQFETYAIDTQVRLQGPAPDSDVAVVLIDDADYLNIFQEKSPLDEAGLKKIIDAIAAGRPRVIGVDIDTSAPEFRALRPQPGWPATVWARNGSFSNRDGRYHVSRLLGEQQPPVAAGLVVSQLDADGAVRRYQRVCETNRGPMDSFAWAVAKQFDPASAARRPPTTKSLFVNFAGDKEGSHRLHFTASRVLELADGPGWQEDSPVKDKIVLLGGAYGATDEHDTPLGWMLGVEVMAYTVETELRGGGLPPPNPVLVTVIGGLAGLGLLLLFQHFTTPKAVLVSLLVIPAVGMLSSLVTFETMAFWAYFVPIPLSVLVQEIYIKVRDYRIKLIKELYQGVVSKKSETEAAADGPKGATPAEAATPATAKAEPES